MQTAFSLLLGLQLLVVPAVFAQSSPVVMSGYANEITVNGTADSSAGTITILDTSYPVDTRLGTGNVSRDGKFAVIVKPALILGHRLVAVDSRGQRSPAFTVAPARSGPTPGTS